MRGACNKLRRLHAFYVSSLKGEEGMVSCHAYSPSGPCPHLVNGRGAAVLYEVLYVRKHGPALRVKCEHPCHHPLLNHFAYWHKRRCAIPFHQDFLAIRQAFAIPFGQEIRALDVIEADVKLLCKRLHQHGLSRAWRAEKQNSRRRLYPVSVGELLLLYWRDYRLAKLLLHVRLPANIVKRVHALGVPKVLQSELAERFLLLRAQRLFLARHLYPLRLKHADCADRKQAVDERG